MEPVTEVRENGTDIAVRTNLAPPRQWFVITQNDGGHYVDAEAVEGWRNIRA